MSLQPGSSYVNYLAVKKLLPLDDYANPYPSTTIFAVDSSGVLAGYDPDAWFSTIGMPNPSTLEGEIVSTIGIINSALGSTLYGLVSTSQIVNQYTLASSLSSTVAGLATTTAVSQAQLDSRIKHLAAEGYVSSTQLASTVAGLGTAGYLSTGAGGILSVRAVSTGSVSLSTLSLVDITAPASKKLLYNSGGGLYFGGALIGGAITDLSLNTLDVSNATVYQDLAVGGSVYVPNGFIAVPNTYSGTISTTVINAEKEAIPRTWGVAGTFGDGTYGVQFSSDNGITWDVSASLFDSATGQINNLVYLNGIWFALGYKSIIGEAERGILYSVDNGATWAGVLETNLYDLYDTNLYNIAYNGSIYLLVGQKGGTSRIWSSTDGITWAIHSTPAIDTIFNIMYNGTYWVICGSGGSQVQYSVDGISWSSASGFSVISEFRQISYNGHTMIISDPFTITDNIYYSEDKGITWTPVTIPSTLINALSWNGTVFVASTEAPSIYTSRDGITWTFRYTPAEPITSIFWNGRIFQAVGQTNTRLQSTDGYTWTTLSSLPQYTEQYAISYSVDVRDDLITTNARYYGVDIPHYYDSTNQIYAGPDRLVLNNTLTVKDGLVGVMKGDPGVHLDIQGAARASTLMTSTLQLADPLSQTVITGRGGMMYVNDIPIVQSTVAGLGQTYVSIPSLTSTVAGLGQTYVSIPSLTSTVAGLGTAGYISSHSLASTVAGLGTAGYVSSHSLASTVAGLGTAGYVSSQSLASTVAGLGQIYVSTQGLTTVIQGLGTIGYVSSQSLASTVGSLLRNLQVSTFSASTIGYAKLFTSTVYLGNDNLSTNTLRFRGVNRDIRIGGEEGYTHTVIGERLYYEESAYANSELLFFKGNDNTDFNGRDRIRHLAGEHQFDIITHNSGWQENADPPAPAISGALFIKNSGYVGVGMTTPQALLDISGAIDSGYTGINTQGTITLANNDPNHKIRLVTTSGASYIQSDISGIVQEGQSKGTGIGNKLLFSRWNGSGVTMTVDTSGGQVGIGTTAPSYSLDVCGSFYASTINYAKLYTSTVYVGNDNASTNMIRFYGTAGDGAGIDQIARYAHTIIAERVYDEPTKSELLLFKGNDGIASSSGPDRIRHLAGAHQFDIITTGGASKFWYDGSGNPPPPDISGLLYMDGSGNGRVGINTITPGATLDVSGYIKGNTIGFHAVYDSSSPLTVLGGSIDFTSFFTILHNIGNGLSGSYFTAPVSGYYFFTVTLKPANYSAFTIRKNATTETNGTEYAGARNDSSVSDRRSASAFIQLNRGNTVSVWVDGTGGNIILANDPVCSFSGYLMMPF